MLVISPLSMVGHHSITQKDMLLVAKEILLWKTMIRSTPRSSTFHLNVEIGSTWFIRQLFIDNAG
jgi:hypothetical protein